MILDTTTRMIEVLLGGAPVVQCPIVAAFADHTTTAFTPGLSQTQTNGVTAVTAVAAPVASTQRQVKWLSVYNPNAADVVVTVQLNDNATLRIMVKKTLTTGQVLQYVDGSGWQVIVVETLLQFNDAEGNPVDVDATAAADGTSGYVARRDHRHLLGIHATQHKSGGSDEVAVAAAAANAIPKAGAGGTLAAGWIQEVIALADLSDVTAKTGTGTIVVMDTSPTIVTPTVASFANAGHSHQNAAGGGQLDHGLALTGLTDNDHTQYVLRSLFTTLGDVAYFSTEWARLPGNPTTTRNYLTQIGTGAASAAPIWTTIATADIVELLALADLSDVTGKTGTGTTVVMDTSPTIVTPVIASFVTAGHSHQNAVGGGQLDHGLALTGLGDDDHTVYALLAGRATGQTLSGGIAASENLTLQSTAHATKGEVIPVGDLSLGSAYKARMTGQNRFRHLNSMVQVYLSAAQSIANNTLTIINWPNERIDTDGLHDNVTNNSRLTAAVAGKYLIMAAVGFVVNATGIRLIQVLLNGTTGILYSEEPGSGSAETTLYATGLWSLAAGDYIELQMYQNSGAALNTQSVEKQIHFGMVYVGE